MEDPREPAPPCIGLCGKDPCGCPPGRAVRFRCNLDLPDEFQVAIVLSADWWDNASYVQRTERMSQFIKRAREQRKKYAQPLPPDESFQAEYPALWEFLTITKDEGGKARKTATLTVFVSDGSFKASLNDRQEGCSCFAGADAFLEALAALEQAIAEGTAEWREWKIDGGSGARRKN